MWCWCQVVGLYRLCGSAAVKKELRDWFERNSSAVCLSEDLYPDINVITGKQTPEEGNKFHGIKKTLCCRSWLLFDLNQISPY